MALVLIVTLLVSALAVPPSAGAQPASKVPRVGVLSPGTSAATAHFDAAFKQALREHGYVEGRNIVLERRYSEGKLERMAEIAAEVVRLKVDVIVAASDPVIAAAKRQTQSIPIVMVSASDPVGTGFVASLARPGGSITGTSTMSSELAGKRLELLREALPKLSRVAVIWNPDVRGALLDYKALEEPARSLRVQLQSLEVSQADDLARALSSMAAARAEAVIVITPNPALFTNRTQVTGFVQRHRLPSMYGGQDWVDDGGLMAYGTSNTERWRRTATYVDKILKGAKPGDLPVEQPTKFELVINLKAARALGLTIPQSLLRRADRVIQ